MKLRAPLLLIVCLLLASSFLFLGGEKAAAVSAADWKPGRIIDDVVFQNKNSMTVAQIQTFLNSQLPSCDTHGTGLISYKYNPNTRKVNANNINESGDQWITTSRALYTYRVHLYRKFYRQANDQYAGSPGAIANYYNPPTPYTPTISAPNPPGIPDAEHSWYTSNTWMMCLKDFYQNPSNMQSNYGTGVIPAGARSAAQLIHDAAQNQNVNPQVYMVLLQKEQSLIGDNWPWPDQYDKATGNNCPDTAPCNPAYAGFWRQVNNAGAQFNYYVNNFDQYNYAPGWNSILLHPNTACGRRDIFIENAFTAALYIYTPYTPNEAALANMYGTGDGCSSYGNRNFWRIFSDWFGSTTYLDANSIRNNIPVTIVANAPASPAVGQQITYTVSFKNNFASELHLDGVGVVGRAGSMTSGANRDFGWQGPITLSAGETRQFSFTTTIWDIGSIHIWPSILYHGTFVQYNNWGSTLEGRNPNFTLSEALNIDASSVYVGQEVTFSAKIKNNETFAVRYDALGIPVKYQGSQNYDATWVGPGTIAPGAELALSGKRRLDKNGNFTYWVANYSGGRYTPIGPTKSLTAQSVQPNFSVSAVSLSPSTLVQGQNVNATFSVTNNLPVPITVGGVGVVGRYGTFTGPNRDIGWQGPVTFAAGETKNFSGYSRMITEVGTHYYWIGIFYNGSYIQFNHWGRTVVSQAP